MVIIISMGGFLLHFQETDCVNFLKFLIFFIILKTTSTNLLSKEEPNADLFFFYLMNLCIFILFNVEKYKKILPNANKSYFF